MTFTEAALEVLRNAGKPLSFKEIAALAVEQNLLSHVGQAPEATMGERLLALSGRETDRRVVAVDPAGVFALPEWNLAPVAPPAEIVAPPPADEAALRPRERHPPMQSEHVVGGRRDERRRSRDEEGGRKRRYQPPADVAWQWLREKGAPAPLSAIVEALRVGDRIAEALERDLPSFEKALREENRRRQDSGRSPMFAFEGDLVSALEPSRAPVAPARPAPKGRDAVREVARELPKLPVFDEQARNVVRTLRRRLGALDAPTLEKVVVALLEKQGFRDFKLVRRGKEGPTYLARLKAGAGELRYVVRVNRPGRDLGRNEVKELRSELKKFSQQLGVLFGNAECAREAKSEANAPGTEPIVLYGNEALAEALVEAGLGVEKKLIEWLEYDDTFFASAGAGEALPEFDEAEPPADAEPEAGTVPEAAAPAAAEGGAEPSTDGDADRPRRQRERRRDRRRDRPGSDEAAARPNEAAPAGDSTASVSEEPATSSGGGEAVEPVEAAEAVASPETPPPAVEVTEAAAPAEPPEPVAAERAPLARATGVQLEFGMSTPADPTPAGD